MCWDMPLLLDHDHFTNMNVYRSLELNEKCYQTCTSTRFEETFEIRNTLSKNETILFNECFIYSLLRFQFHNMLELYVGNARVDNKPFLWIAILCLMFIYVCLIKFTAQLFWNDQMTNKKKYCKTFVYSNRIINLR